VVLDVSQVRWCRENDVVSAAQSSTYHVGRFRSIPRIVPNPVRYSPPLLSRSTGASCGRGGWGVKPPQVKEGEWVDGWVSEWVGGWAGG
jgi:hypothetical protein